MSEAQEVDVLIVGSGPSGSSTALHLVKSNPDWAGRIVVVDKAVHPREKLCGGGITHMGRNILSQLGLELGVDHFEVNEARLTFRSKQYSFYGKPVFTIVRRDAFDHWLVQTAVRHGVTVRQGEAVKSVAIHDEYVEVVTEQATFHAKTVVAADGSKSFVRRALKWDGPSHVARLVEVLTPENAQTTPEFRERITLFEFDQTADFDLQGYYWDFPSYKGGRPFMNRGVFDSRVQPSRPKADLKAALNRALADRDRDLAEYKLKGHPIRWWDKNGRFAMPRVLLVGDAAGVDPLMGEGISFALGYGKVAAQAIDDAFARKDFSYATYRQLLLKDPLFKQLNTRTWLAKLAYKSWPSWLVSGLWSLMGWGVRHTRWGNRDYTPLEPIQTIWTAPPKIS
jgi:geranylgeranyl reductase family protein